MLTRVLEPEVMDSREEAVAYNAMDHDEVNQKFVDDLTQCGELGLDCLDVGTGTGWIPVLLCKANPVVRVMASDASAEMLDLARYNLEVAQCMHRVQLHYGDAKKMVFQSNYFDTVFSNSLVHHLPVHEEFFQELKRVVRPSGLLFLRDLVRPQTEDALEKLVDTYGGSDECGRQMLRQSFYAALTIDEVKALGESIGVDPRCVEMSSDRHWTIAARADADKNRFVPVSRRECDATT